MIPISIPYGRGHLTVELEERCFLGSFGGALPAAAADEPLEIERALDRPIGSPPLEKLAEGKRSAVIITSDHTRPVPSRLTLPAMLRRLRAGNPGIEVAILVATGMHRATTEAELRDKFGDEIVDEERIVIHDAADHRMMHRLGRLPSGGELAINRLAVEAELLVADGFIEPHFFAGFSGGRKSVLPGIASQASVLANHCAGFIASPRARTGILDGNPIHRDMLWAAEQANLAFILNVVINEEKRLVAAFAGDRVAAHLAGCDFLRGCAGVAVPEADIVITSNGGYPLDQNIYQAVKGMTAGEAVCRPGGVIILAAACNDGAGGEAFHRSMKEAASPAELLDELVAVPADRTRFDQWQIQILCRILSGYRVIVVTADCPHQLLREVKLEAASSLDEALAMARAGVGPAARVAVIPDGVAVIPSRGGGVS